jgi:hypothetical protein
MGTTCESALFGRVWGLCRLVIAAMIFILARSSINAGVFVIGIRRLLRDDGYEE